MPFATVAFKGTTTGTTTDFDGFYTLKTTLVGDSLTASNVGYASKSKAVQKNVALQVIDFQLKATENALEEVVVRFAEDPAYPIMRKVIAARDKNSKRSLSAYACENYTKIEFDADNLSEKFRKRRIIKKITAVVDSIEKIAGENGKPILPLFISESISKFYYLSKPEKQKEIIQKTKLTGMGLQDGSTVSQLIGSSFQQYDFYKNWLNILDKDFVSPLADGWNTYYKYYLDDSLWVGEHWCYKIEINPKRPQDLAFTGNIWIDSKTFALKQIDVQIGKQANINFIEKIKIQQESAPTSIGAWLPVKTRVLVDVVQLTKNTTGMLAKFYTSNKDFTVNDPQPIKFYDTPLSIEETARKSEPDYWQTHRHDSLSSTEQNVYKMIDSVKNIPTVKTYIEIANIALNGYKKIGIIEFGPYALMYANNNIEGIRPRIGIKTNYDFSKKLILKGYVAYGFTDKRFKYDAQAHYILNRRPWTMIGYKFRYELEQVGRLTEDLYDNTLFLASIRFGTLRRAFMRNDHQLYFQTDVIKGVTQTFKFRHFDFKPDNNSFNFAYYKGQPEGNTEIGIDFRTTEITGETRIAANETFVINDNERISLGTRKLPVLTFSYTVGIKGALESDFNYLKLGFNASQTLRLGTLGRANYTFTAGYTPSRLPYPLLFVHRGNESFFYNASTYNLMNFFEFVSDSYVSFRYEQYFEGLFFNRIPLIKKLRWRLVASSNVLWGTVRKENRNLLPETFNGLPIDG
ncbi:MAG: carboxypeptidase-like regulatory domain-containing protein, partial [Verrucomicrobia bacterium]|nr:carboxypeptidase-like regulatory domain-containing protein [Cytophagales bacterium]